MPMHHFLEWHVSQYMTKNVKAIPPSMTLHELGALFEQHDYNCFPVVEGECLCGHRQQVRFSEGVCVYDKAAPPALSGPDAAHGRRES